MRVFIYIGKPTYGMTTKTIKAPATGGWITFTGVIPNVTELETSDIVTIAYFLNNPKAFTELI